MCVVPAFWLWVRGENWMGRLLIEGFVIAFEEERVRA